MLKNNLHVEKSPIQEALTEVTVSGRQFTLSYFEVKRNDALVLFIHGIGDCKEDYKSALEDPVFSKYSMIAADLIGFGKSSKPVEYDYSIEDQADALLDLLNSKDYLKFHIVCHSVGGAVGVLLAEKLGDRLASVLNIEGNLIGADCGIVTRETIDASFEDYSTVLWDARKKRLEGRDDRIAAHEAMSKEAFYKTSISVVAWSDSEKLLEKFNSFKVPTAYLFGDENRDYPVIQCLGSTQKIEIPNCGHRPMDDNPVIFYEEIGAFLEAVK